MYVHSPQNPPKHIFPWDLHHKMLQKCVWFLGNLQRKTSANAIFDFLKCVCLLGYLQCTASANAMCWYSLGRAPWRKLKNPNKLEKNWKRKCFLRLLARPPPICFFDVFFRFSQGCCFLTLGFSPKSLKILLFLFFRCFLIFSGFCFVPFASNWSICEMLHHFHFVRCCLLAYTFLCNDWKPFFNMSTCILFFVVLLLRGFLHWLGSLTRR